MYVIEDDGLPREISMRSKLQTQRRARTVTQRAPGFAGLLGKRVQKVVYNNVDTYQGQEVFRGDITVATNVK